VRYLRMAMLFGSEFGFSCNNQIVTIVGGVSRED
jgi:hypothetical protein